MGLVLAYALALLPLVMAGHAAARASSPDFQQLCSVVGASGPEDSRSGDAGAMHAVCCCLPGAHGAPFTPSSPVAGGVALLFARFAPAPINACSPVAHAATHPSARPRAPPAVADNLHQT